TSLVKVFVSYSHNDRKYLRPNSLMGALEGLRAEGVEFWTDQAVATGNKWDEEIRRRIAESDIALVLVSQADLDSSYCQNTEIRSFLMEVEKRGLIIFPIMLSRCEYERHDWLNSRQFIPSDNKNIEEHYGRAERRGPLFHEIRRDLRIQIENIRQSRTLSSG
ncbi:MAG TPA: toll/interleukin-1 receptor domain-containing protein, partial [Pyrinomonadaceae bacterium]|nr:toll/interleukin-1 receptor domain-containing protein [Pyrinomonadaceae bacterium]